MRVSPEPGTGRVSRCPSGSPSARSRTQPHHERITGAAYPARWNSLPDEVFIATDSRPAVVGDHPAVWADTATTIGSRCHVLAGAATVLISTPTVEIIRAGFSVQIHDSARKARAVAERAHAT